MPNQLLKFLRHTYVVYNLISFVLLFKADLTTHRKGSLQEHRHNKNKTETGKDLAKFSRYKHKGKEPNCTGKVQSVKERPSIHGFLVTGEASQMWNARCSQTWDSFEHWHDAGTILQFGALWVPDFLIGDVQTEKQVLQKLEKLESLKHFWCG